MISILCLNYETLLTAPCKIVLIDKVNVVDSILVADILVADIVVTDIAIGITEEEISVSHKHLALF